MLAHKAGQPQSAAAMQIVPQIFLDPTSQNADGAPHGGDINALHMAMKWCISLELV